MKRPILLILIISLSLSFSSCASLLGPGSGIYVSRGDACYEKGDYNKAIENYDRAVSLNSKNAGAYCGKAKALNALEKYDDAIKCCDKALALDNELGDAYNTKGSAFSGQLKNENALENYIKALELDPDNATYLNNVAYALNGLDKYEEALKYSEKAIEKNPRLTAAYLNKGNALEGLGKTEEALKFYDMAIRLDPKNPSAYSNKGCALQNVDKDDEAIENFDKALEIDPEDHEVLYFKADSLIYLGKYDEAIKCLDKSIELSPKTPQYYEGKGRALYYSGKYKESLDCFDSSLKIKPEGSNALLWKAKSYINQEEYEKAGEICKNVIKSDSENPFAYDVKGNLLVAQYKYKESIPLFDKAIGLSPLYEDAYADKTGAYYYMKDYTRCIKFSQDTAKKFPNNIDVLWFLADCYSAKNMHNEAIGYYKKVLDINPDNDRFYSLIAYEYFLMQDYKNSETYCKKALDKNKDNKTAINLQKELDKEKLPEGQRIASFVSENYLYFDKVKDFDKKTKLFTAKKELSIRDIENYIKSVKQRSDIFTFVVSGKDYDMLMEAEKSSKLTVKELDKSTIYVRIDSFTENTSLQFKEAIDNIKNPAEKILVIDLTDNGGGLAKQSNEILDFLLPACTTSYLIYRDGYIDSYYSDINQTRFKKIYIFTNEHTASSSELLTLGLKNYLPNVKVIGRTTLGKGVGQIVYENKSKKYMIFLVSFYWNVKEKNVQGQKITPDIRVWGNKTDDFMKAVYKDISGG